MSDAYLMDGWVFNEFREYSSTEAHVTRIQRITDSLGDGDDSMSLEQALGLDES